MAQIPSFDLNSGHKMPVFGLGTYLSEPGEVESIVATAIDLGYRLIDTAFYYGNEKEIGNAIKKKIEDGTVKREDLFVTSKLWNNRHKEESVVPMCKKSLENLGLTYLDLYLIHWPFAFVEGDELSPLDANGMSVLSDTDYLETWRGMEKCVDLGLAHSIGVSNFNSEQITRLLGAVKIPPSNNQVECNVNLNQKRLVEFCKKLNISVTGYAPLGRPGNKAGVPNSLDHPTILKLTKKYKKTAPQIALRYVLQQGVIIIPKTVTPSRLKENIDIFDFSLTTDELAEVDKIGSNTRIAVFNAAKASKYWPFAIPF